MFVLCASASWSLPQRSKVARRSRWQDGHVKVSHRRQSFLPRGGALRGNLGLAGTFAVAELLSLEPDCPWLRPHADQPIFWRANSTVWTTRRCYRCAFAICRSGSRACWRGAWQGCTERSRRAALWHSLTLGYPRSSSHPTASSVLLFLSISRIGA